MNEPKYSEKNDNLEQLINNYADILGGGISGTLGFLAGGPLAAAFAGTAGAVVTGLIKGIGQEFSKRQLSPREDYRVGKVLAIAALEIHQRLEKGESLRGDGFLDEKPIDRSDIEDVAEGVLLKCQREPQEKKIEYMGYLFASFHFNAINSDMAHQLIKAAEELTYRQLCILKLAVVRDKYGLRNQNYRSQVKFPKELYSVLYECKDLHDREYINFDAEIGSGLTNTIPGSMTLQAIGNDLFNLMKLSSIPDEDIIPIAEVLK